MKSRGFITSTIPYAFAFAVIVASVGTATEHANAAPVGKGKDPGLIDCSAGDLVSDAVALGVSEIIVNGTCTENVDIRGQTNITIRGANLDGNGNPTDEIIAADSGSPVVRAWGSQNIVVGDLKITGGRNTVAVFGTSQMFMTNIEASGGSPNTLFIGDNSWGQVTDSSIVGRVTLLRFGTLRIFKNFVDNGVANNAMTLANSVAYSYETDFTGNIEIFSSSRVWFGDTFIGTPYGQSIVDATDLNECRSFSNFVTENSGAPNADSVVDRNGVPLTQADFAIFNCQLSRFAP